MASSSPTPRSNPQPDDAQPVDPMRAGVTVDPAWARKHDENQWEVRRLQWSAVIVALVAIGVSALVLWLSDAAVWAWVLAALLVVFALGSLAMIVYIPRSMGSPRDRFARGTLVPAVVAEVRPRGLTLLALVDRSVDPADGPRPALVTRSCEKLPGHRARVGERVPCVAIGGNRTRSEAAGGEYRFVTPTPVAWASSDAGQISRCAERIPASGWDVLRASLPRLAEVEQAPGRMLAL